MDPVALASNEWSDIGRLLTDLWIMAGLIALFAANMMITHVFMPSLVASCHAPAGVQKTRPVFYALVAIADYYGPSEITLPLGEGVELELTQETVHPRKARVDLRVSPSRAAPFPLKLRVPYWASRAGTAERQGPGSIVATYTDSV